MGAWKVSVVAVLAVTIVSCSSKGDKGGGDVCAQATSKLRSCNLITMGAFDQCEAPETAQERCEYNCVINAPCNEVSDFVCDQQRSTGITNCQLACIAQNGFACGDGTRVPVYYQCDGEDDCDNGADEVGCATFMCADGNDTIPESYKCDGWDDCFDGSDEVGCPTGTTFACATGNETVPASFQCDGDDDCADASDEAGCPDVAELICN